MKKIRVFSICMVFLILGVVGISSLDTEAAGVTIKVFHSDANGEYITYSTSVISKLSPEKLMEQLYIFDLVPENVRINSFSQYTENNKKLLVLDLSQEYSTMLNGMGSSGEYIAFGGLVDTFLDAYSADSIRVTINGAVLETSHAEYAGFFNFYYLKFTLDYNRPLGGGFVAVPY